MYKCIVGSMILVGCVLGWSVPGRGEQLPGAARGTAHRGYSTPRTGPPITLHVFEHLMEPDKDGQLVPRLATSWRWLDDRTLEVTLRQGVTFHNGEVFDAEIVKLNWEENTRLGQPTYQWHLYELHAGITPGDPRCADRALPVSRAGRRRPSQAQRHAYRQPPVLSRGRLGREALVNHRRRRPVGHGPIQAGGRLLSAR